MFQLVNGYTVTEIQRCLYFIFLCNLAEILKARLLHYITDYETKFTTSLPFKKTVTLLCTDVGTASHQHGFEACDLLIGLGLCWLNLSALN
jgi:hypothetical protein